MKSWLKNLSKEYIYAEQNPNRTRDICFQSRPFRNPEWLTVFLKFSLWGWVPKKWQVTRGFLLWFFLSWGIDYQKKVRKQNLEESPPGLLTTLFPTVQSRQLIYQQNHEKFPLWVNFYKLEIFLQNPPVAITHQSILFFRVSFHDELSIYKNSLVSTIFAISDHPVKHLKRFPCQSKY